MILPGVACTTVATTSTRAATATSMCGAIVKVLLALLQLSV